MQQEVSKFLSGFLDTTFDLGSRDEVVAQAQSYAAVSTELCALSGSSLLVPLLNQVNANHLSDTAEVILTSLGSTGQVQYLTSLRDCSSGKCVPAADSEDQVLACLQQGSSYVGAGNLTVNYAGRAVYSAAFPAQCPSLGSSLCVVFNADLKVKQQAAQGRLVDTINFLNPTVNGEEFMFYPTQQSMYPTSTLTFASQCPNGVCGPDSAALAALGGITNDTLVGTSSGGAACCLCLLRAACCVLPLSACILIKLD